VPYGITESLTQLFVLAAAPLLLILIVYFSAKVLRASLHLSSGRKPERDGIEELLQLLLVSELVDSHRNQTGSTSNSSLAKDQEA
jgi:hypothetical protein